ncbi:DUF1778 domain-containing protein [Corallococcus sp. EGB]|uniref:type II toxin -antitoxin system TacA 1-like antitoxin n=1 Tax=Corallococcus sp. EGB TaxID=1521117 RepID=UPI001CBE667B
MAPKLPTLEEDDPPSTNRQEWTAREAVRVVLLADDFDRLVDALEKPAKPLPRLRELARKKAR